MNEAEWVKHMADAIEASVTSQAPSLSVRIGEKIPYGFEVRSYGTEIETTSTSFQTDLAIIEHDEQGQWKPRVIRVSPS